MVGVNDRIGRRDQVLAVRQLVFSMASATGSTLAGRNASGLGHSGRPQGPIIQFATCSQGRRAAIIGQPERHRRARSSDLQIGNVNVLVADKGEEFVLDERAAERPPAV